jgi:hypothetical protein
MVLLRWVAEEDQAAQTLAFDGTDKAFRIGVALGNSRRAAHGFDAARAENLAERFAVFSIAVDVAK